MSKHLRKMKEVSQTNIWANSFPSSRNSQCKGAELQGGAKDAALNEYEEARSEREQGTRSWEAF